MRATNLDAIVALADRQRFVETLPEPEKQLYLSGKKQYPDGLTIVVIRPSGCMRGKENSGFNAVMDENHLYDHHDFEFAVSVGAIEQTHINHVTEGLGIYTYLLENGFIKNGFGALRLLARAVSASYGLATDDVHVALRTTANNLSLGTISPPVRMSQLSMAMNKFWSDSFMKHRAQLFTIATNALTGQPTVLDMKEAYRKGGRTRVIAYATASSHIIGAAGDAPLIEIEDAGKTRKIPHFDGFFSAFIPFDVIMEQLKPVLERSPGSLRILLPLSLPLEAALQLTEREKKFILKFSSAFNPKAAEVMAAHEKVALRYAAHIRDSGRIRSTAGHDALVTMIEPGPGDPSIRTMETRPAVLEAGLQRGRARALEAIAMAKEIVTKNHARIQRFVVAAADTESLIGAPPSPRRVACGWEPAAHGWQSVTRETRTFTAA